MIDPFAYLKQFEEHLLNSVLCQPSWTNCISNLQGSHSLLEEIGVQRKKNSVKSGRIKVYLKVQMEHDSEREDMIYLWVYHIYIFQKSDDYL